MRNKFGEIKSLTKLEDLYSLNPGDKVRYIENFLGRDQVMFMTYEGIIDGKYAFMEKSNGNKPLITSWRSSAYKIFLGASISEKNISVRGDNNYRIYTSWENPILYREKLNLINGEIKNVA